MLLLVSDGRDTKLGKIAHVRRRIAPIVNQEADNCRSCESLSLTAPTLEEFVRRSDARMYHPTHGLAPLVQRATIHLLNPTDYIPTLHDKLKQLDLVDESRVRPTWDAYFMQLSSLAALRSNCMKRRVGCVVVREKRVISTGYNGTPRGMLNCNEGGCKRCNDGEVSGMGLNTCLCLHAEENALLEAGRERIREGSVLYCDTYVHPSITLHPGKVSLTCPGGK